MMLLGAAARPHSRATRPGRGRLSVMFILVWDWRRDAYRDGAIAAVTVSRPLPGRLERHDVAAPAVGPRIRLAWAGPFRRARM